MNIERVPANSGEIAPIRYKFTGKKGKLQEVHPKHSEEASVIDTDKDGLLTDDEIKIHLRNRDILRDPRFAQIDEKSILRDYKRTLQDQPIEQTPAYHSFEDITNELTALAEKYPDRAELISIGKSYEGRDLWALKITKRPEPDPENPTNPTDPQDPANPSEPGNGQEPVGSPKGIQKQEWLISSKENQEPGQEPPGQQPPGQQPPPDQQPEVPQKPGIVITGLHHAREWITAEVPLFAAKHILENYETDPAMKKRVDDTTIWIVPVVNPDGYEYSRNESFWWRKNRQPITETACDIEGQGNLCSLPGGVGTSQRDDQEIKGYGIDLNRNYMDDNPENYYLYRHEGDTPCSSWDDEGASDRIYSDTYRGPSGAIAPEVAAMQNLLKNNNIKAAIDFHSYGRMILYPWGHNYDQAENKEELMNLGNNMAQIIHDSDEDEINYRVMQSSDLYPATGSSEDFEHVNKILAFTIELGRSFAPDEKDIDPIRKRLFGAELYLIDYVMNKPPEEEPTPQQPVPQEPAEKS